MTRQEAIRHAVDQQVFEAPGLVVQFIKAKGGDILYWLDLCELIVRECPVHGYRACFAATVAADEYVKSL